MQCITMARWDRHCEFFEYSQQRDIGHVRGDFAVKMCHLLTQ